MVKNLPTSAGNTRDPSSIPGKERSPGIGNGNPLQYSCLENPMDRKAMDHKELDATEQVGTRAHALRESWQTGEELLLWVSLASGL